MLKDEDENFVLFLKNYYNILIIFFIITNYLYGIRNLSLFGSLLKVEPETDSRYIVRHCNSFHTPNNLRYKVTDGLILLLIVELTKTYLVSIRVT